LAHEMGHYVAGRIHGVAVSPPHFIPLPFSLLGTMGAVISMSGRIRSRDALLDVGASGPIAGMVLALPLLIYGVLESPVEPLDMSQPILLEGHSLLYEAVLFALKGPFPPGHDITLTPTALAAWAGLFVTMLNLLPFGQLDGGHISYALVGPRQDRISRWMVRLLPLLALGVSAFYGLRSYLAGEHASVIEGNAYAGVPWLVWGVLLLLMARYSGYEHPPTDDDTLSPGRRAVAIGCIVLFALLFMPAMLRSFDGSQ
ncbi:MAG: site-2 protease family protein, partial [Myxococcota bacterium]